MVASVATGSLWNPVRAVLVRVPRLFVGTSGLIGMLGLLQWSTLDFVRLDDGPVIEPLRQVVVDFSVSSDSRWAVSRTLVNPVGRSKQPLRSALHLHDLTDLSRPRGLAIDGHAAHVGVLSPDGTRVAFSTREGDLGLIDLRDPSGSIQRLGGVSPDWIARLCWSPDSDHLLASTYHSIVGWTLPMRTPGYRLPIEDMLPPCLAVASDSRSFVTTPAGRMVINDLATGESLREFSLSGLVYGVAYADRMGLVVTNGDEGLVARSSDNGEVRWREPCSPALQFPIALSGDERWLLNVVREIDEQGRRSNRVIVRQTDSGQTVAVIEPLVGQIAGVAFAPNGMLYAWGDAGAIAGWDIAHHVERWRYGFPPPGPDDD